MSEDNIDKVLYEISLFPIFEIVAPDGQRWEIFVDGRTKGFPDEVGVYNFAKPFIDRIVGIAKRMELDQKNTPNSGTAEPGMKYYIGDVVEFTVGGVGVIDSVFKAHNGLPESYSTKEVEGLPYRKDTKCAWHYEGDFKALVGESAIRSLVGRKPGRRRIVEADK